MNAYKNHHKNSVAFMEYAFSDRNQDVVSKVPRMPANIAIENLIMIASAKYNIDIMQIYEKLKKEGKI